MRQTWTTGILLALMIAGCSKPQPQAEAPSTRKAPDQPDQPPEPKDVAPPPPPVSQADFYHEPEGSELFPLSFLRALKGADGEVESFMDQKNLDRYGLLPDPANTNGLPVGLTLDKVANPALTGFYVVGFNCAACHVGELKVGNDVHRIDGAPNMLDIKTFNDELGSTLTKMLKSPKEVIAFFRRLRKLPDARDGTTRSTLIADPDEVTRQLYDQLPELADLKKGKRIDKLLAKDIEATISRERDAVEKLSLDDLREAQGGGVEAGAVPEPAGSTPSAAPRGLDEKLPGSLVVSVVNAKISLEDRGKFASDALREALAEGDGVPEFLGGVPRGDSGRGAVYNFLTDLAQTVRWIAQRVELLKRINSVGRKSQNVETGPGRVDAFVTARNLLFGVDSAIKTTAPICYPHLWGFKDAKWLHWDANTDSIMERNIGQALGLGAVVRTNFESSVLVRNIHRLEIYASQIKPPKWPFGDPDKTSLSEGEKLFITEKCWDCHQPGIAKAGEEGIDVGTDPERHQTFNVPVAEKPFHEALSETLKKVKKKAFDREQVKDGELGEDGGHWRGTKGYAKRSLEGIWASAPYLHNGSVPSLEQLLTPPAKRKSKFKVGSRDYNVNTVGYEIDRGPFIFDTSIPGNRNTGHDYGTKLSPAQKQQLIDYLKML
jgi:hypothetical protein